MYLIIIINFWGLSSVKMSLNRQEKMLFSEIMFQAEGREKQGIEKLTEDEITKLRKLYAQKIAFDAVNTHLEAPPDFIPQNSPQAPIPGVLSTLCCCFYPEQNKDNFDIKSSQFTGKLFSVLKFWRKDFISNKNSRIQLYGPLWISVTYIIILGLSANLNTYFIQPKNFQFNNQLMVYAIGLTVIFQIAQPMIYSAVVKCLKGSIPSNQSLMITGYSLLLYVLPTFLCLVPSLYWHIVMLGLAGLFRAIFLFRNYSSRLDSKLYLMLLVILIIQALYCFILLKVMFAQNNGYQFQKGTQKIFHLMTLRDFGNHELINNAHFFTHVLTTFGF